MFAASSLSGTLLWMTWTQPQLAHGPAPTATGHCGTPLLCRQRHRSLSPHACMLPTSVTEEATALALQQLQARTTAPAVRPAPRRIPSPPRPPAIIRASRRSEGAQGGARGHSTSSKRLLERRHTGLAAHQALGPAKPAGCRGGRPHTEATELRSSSRARLVAGGPGLVPAPPVRICTCGFPTGVS